MSVEAFYPERWKLANFVLIQNPEHPSKESSLYRAFCLFETTGKLFERILVRKLSNYLEITGVNNQLGFRKRRSTIYAIKKLHTIIIKVINAKGYVVEMLTLDVSNVFNSTLWNKITNAFRRMGVLKYLHDIVEAYCTNRKVVYDIDSEAKLFVVECEVHQESILGPCL